MKSTEWLSKSVACTVIVAATLSVCPARGDEGRAFVRAIRGSAHFSTSRDEWKPLRVGVALAPSSTVRTGVNSQVDLFLGENGPTVRLLPETTLGLDKLNLERTGIDVVIETFLDLQKGTIQGNVKRLAAASKYEVKTPITLCVVKGTDTLTEYQISADGIVHVKEGTILVVYVGISGVGRGYGVNKGLTFAPPVDRTDPAAPPIVRPTRPDELPAVITDGDGDFFFPAPPPLEPVQFISPGTGTPASNR